MKLTARFFFAGLATLGVSGALGSDFQEVARTNMDYRPEGAHMTLRAAVHVAEQQALKAHISLADYRSPRFSYSSDHHWLILYEWKTPMPGGHFIVDIDDRTQQGNLMPGE